LKIRRFFLFFLISGFCSLVYEVVWLRLAMARFGVTTPMVSIVLSVFMAGLGIGSWAGGALMRRLGRSRAAAPLRLYGVLELLIGLSSVVAPWTIESGYQWLRSGHYVAWNSSSYYLVAGAWTAISLLPWCTCMGATFPFAMAAIRRLSFSESRQSFSYLYLANVLGAILGTLVPAFILIELLGFHGTLEVARALNLLLGAGVILLSFAPTPDVHMEEIAAKPGSGSRSILWLLFATGLCSMAMEVVWIREFTIYLGNVVYAFASILAIYLGATFFGSQWYRKRSNPQDPRVGVQAWILVGAASLLPLLAADPRLEPVKRFIGWEVLRAVAGVGPFSAVVGFLTPMLVDRWSAGDPDRAGRAYAVNVAGSILGPLVAGFWILPWLGERWGLCALALPLFAIGVSSLRSTAARLSVGLRPAPSFAAALTASLVLIFATQGYETLYHDRMELRDYTATVIATGEGMNRRLLVNGIGMTALTPITKMMAHLPLSLLGHPPQNSLVICFGMGTTFRSMTTWGIDATAVELVPSVPKLFGYFHSDGPKLLESPHARVVVDDGRRFLERTPDQFDVIAVDPPPPTGAPASSFLYSRQFYSVLMPHLKPGGIAQIWFPGGEPASGGDEATLASVAKALRDSFPYVRAFQSTEGWGVHFLASAQAFPNFAPGDLPQKMPQAAADDLVEWSDATPQEMMADVLGREMPLNALIAGQPAVPPVEDDRPINEYFFLRTRLQKYIGYRMYGRPAVTTTAGN